MQANRNLLEEQLARYENKLVELNSFLKELGARAAEYGTEPAHFEEDVSEAEHNVRYFEAEAARIRHELSDTSVRGAVLPPEGKQRGGGALALALVSFTAGVLLGSVLNPRGRTRG